jgi:hypothetical protein
MHPLLWVHRMVTPVKWGSDDLPALTNFVTGQWIDHQITYHKKKHGDMEALGERLERYGQGCFWLAVLFASSHLTIAFFIPWLHHTLIDTLLTLAALMLPPAAAGLAGFTYHRELKRLPCRVERWLQT